MGHLCKNFPMLKQFALCRKNSAGLKDERMKEN